eukprot:475172-Rhodomonas_salina.1
MRRKSSSCPRRRLRCQWSRWCGSIRGFLMRRSRISQCSSGASACGPALSTPTFYPKLRRVPPPAPIRLNVLNCTRYLLSCLGCPTNKGVISSSPLLSASAHRGFSRLVSAGVPLSTSWRHAKDSPPQPGT